MPKPKVRFKETESPTKENELKDPEAKKRRRRWTPEDKQTIVTAWNNGELKPIPNNSKYVLDPINKSPILIVQIKTWAKVFERQDKSSKSNTGMSAEWLDQFTDLVVNKVLERFRNI
jgi:hypothetical protein